MSRPLAVILPELSDCLAESAISSALIPANVRRSVLLAAEALGSIQLAIEGLQAADAGELRAAMGEARADLAEVAPAVAGLSRQVEALRLALADAEARTQSLRAELAAALAAPASEG